ncbi:cytochrome b/b6 domain-containing protein [Candidatus Thiodiazotropha sp. CDECU1]|uniref:cytochrome b/b6 domain-containing protein n=1 Tax=Candidatus Thiodiazotropha sp. CDECU1 TaxID=3065865 RepID=UPI00292CFBD6|nr:cytochrome b/b6 domain-containing protein [Candidatus Thiodiazotropha sp. CDECU1]
MSETYYFTLFERLWHWSQALLIIGMLITGFEIHGSYHLLGFEQAIDLHTIMAWVLIGLWLLALFWHTTTGEWRQYVPSDPDSMLASVKYYAIGIFLGAPHPFHRRRAEKHNPVQRMVYLMLTMVITPIIWISGLLYLFYQYWAMIGIQGVPLGFVAVIHTIGAFAMLCFIPVHLYMSLTTSEKPFGYLFEMIFGHEANKN